MTAPTHLPCDILGVGDQRPEDNVTPTPNATRAGELLPCPWCGEVPTLIRETDGYKWGAVVCCGNGPEVRTGYEDVEHWRADAIAAWNRRAPLAPAVVDAGTLERARALLEEYDVAGAESLGAHVMRPNDDARESTRLHAARVALLDALATAAQPARAVPDRDAVEDAITDYGDARADHMRSGHKAPRGRVDAARAALLALVYAPAAAGGDADAEAQQ